MPLFFWDTNFFNHIWRVKFLKKWFIHIRCSEFILSRWRANAKFINRTIIYDSYFFNILILVILTISLKYIWLSDIWDILTVWIYLRVSKYFCYFILRKILIANIVTIKINNWQMEQNHLLISKLLLISVYWPLLKYNGVVNNSLHISHTVLDYCFVKAIYD